jgi:hypothetical protein
LPERWTLCAPYRLHIQTSITPIDIRTSVEGAGVAGIGCKTVAWFDALEAALIPKEFVAVTCRRRRFPQSIR